jgi:calcium-dependent protein kinase
LATKDEKSELLKTFQALDLNNDGKLSKEELMIGTIIIFLIFFSGYAKIMNAAEAEEEVNRIMS